MMEEETRKIYYEYRKCLYKHLYPVLDKFGEIVAVYSTLEAILDDEFKKSF